MIMMPRMMIMAMVGMFAGGGGRAVGAKKAEMDEDRKDYLRYLGPDARPRPRGDGRRSARRSSGCTPTRSAVVDRVQPPHVGTPAERPGLPAFACRPQLAIGWPRGSFRRRPGRSRSWNRSPHSRCAGSCAPIPSCPICPSRSRCAVSRRSACRASDAHARSGPRDAGAAGTFHSPGRRDDRDRHRGPREGGVGVGQVAPARPAPDDVRRHRPAAFDGRLAGRRSSSGSTRSCVTGSGSPATPRRRPTSRTS